MLKSLPLLSAVVLLALGARATTGGAPPASGAGQKPTASASAEAQARIKKIFELDCAMCHNQNGDGKNDMDIKNVPDFTNPDVQSKATDGQWFGIIQKGKGDMPPEEPRAKSNDDLWNLVNYCRSFGKK